MSMEYIDETLVSEVLLADGWHKVEGVFSVDFFSWGTEEGPLGLGEFIGFTFDEKRENYGGTKVVNGPISSVLAVRMKS